MTTSKTRRVIFHFDEHSQMSPEQLEARGIVWDRQAYVEGRICFPTVSSQTVSGLFPTPQQGTQEKTLYQRLEHLLCGHRLALTGDDPLAQESALNVLQALVHEELQKVRASIVVWRLQSAGDVPWLPPQNSGAEIASEREPAAVVRLAVG